MNTNSNPEPAGTNQKVIAELHHVLAGMQDALTDEMVSRLAETLSQGVGMLDQLERSGLDKILPVLTVMVENGDLVRIVQLARVFSALQDAATDEMISRLTELVSNGMTLLDRVNRTGLDDLVTALPHMVATFNQLHQQHVFDDLVESIEAGTGKADSTAAASGGVKGLWAMARDPDTQETLRHLVLVGSHFRACRAERQQTKTVNT